MDTKVITCAFCEGTGKDPFGIMSPLSVCQVCGGKGSVTVREPAIVCAFCRGSGVHDDQRLTCTVCGGKGMVTIKEPVEKCPHCQGTGVNTGINYLSCALCGGKGVITVKKREKQPV